MGVRLSTPRAAPAGARAGRRRAPSKGAGRRRLAWLWCGLLAVGCAADHDDVDADTPVQVSLAPLANDECVGARPLALPSTVDTIVVERSSPEGWTPIQHIEPGGSQLLTGVGTGDAILRFVACVDRAPAYATGSTTLAVGEAGKAGLDLHFKPLNRLACTGTTQGPTYNRYAGLGRPRAFAVAAPLDDGRVLIAGGADLADGPRLSAEDTARTWDVYTPGESLFLPGVERAQVLEPRTMQAPRIGARAVPWQPVGAERPGVLVIGGAPAVQLGVANRTGPLVPDGPSLSRPAAEFFDPQRGSFAPLAFVDGAVLSERFLAGVAVGDGGRVVIVGGVTWTADGPAGGVPSDRVEIIDGDRLYTVELPRAPDRTDEAARNPLLGVSVTPIGGGRFFVWGGDVNGCGQRPGWLLSLDGGPQIQPLELRHETAPPTCAAVQGCRPWYSTAFHAATPLDGSPERPRVLITGGLVMGPTGPSNNPDPGEACGPNVFVAEIDPAALTVEIRPVPTDFETGGQLKRAFHTAAPAGGDRVLLAGGWAFLGNANLFASADDVLFYRDARPVGAVSAGPDRLSVPRLGGLGLALPGGGVLLAGGLVRDPAVGELRVTEAAEVYTPPLATTVCSDGG